MLGTDSVDITPPAGAMMACFPRKAGGKPRIASGAHDPLQARAMVFGDGNVTAAVVSADLTMIRAVDAAAIREAVGGSLPELAGPQCIIAASHTHHAPETAYLFGNAPDDPWVRRMDGRIADAVVRAWAKKRPVSVSMGMGQPGLTHNRRVVGDDGRSRMVFDHDPAVTTGPTDPDLTAFRFEDADGHATVLFHYAAHALAAGPKTNVFTADWPGAARRTVADGLNGAAVAFLNGAAGDIHPVESMRAGFGAVERIGRDVGQAVLDALERSQPIDNPALGFATDRVAFPNRMDPDRKVSVELSCLRIGPAVLGTMPGELFCSQGLRFKEAAAPNAGLLVGYANDWLGYLPDRQAYETGGYGVDAARADPPERSRTAAPPGAAEACVDRLISMARCLLDAS